VAAAIVLLIIYYGLYYEWYIFFEISKGGAKSSRGATKKTPDSACMPTMHMQQYWPQLFIPDGYEKISTYWNLVRLSYCSLRSGSARIIITVLVLYTLRELGTATATLLWNAQPNAYRSINIIFADLRSLWSWSNCCSNSQPVGEFQLRLLGNRRSEPVLVLDGAR
jgi:hypothetical protein